MFTRSLLLVLFLVFPLTVMGEQNESIDELRDIVETKKSEYQQAKTAYEEAKKRLENALKKQKLAADNEVPCTCVFNKNRAWNPEKIIWRDVFWECANYREDGTCSKVRKVEGAVVE